MTSHTPTSNGAQQTKKEPADPRTYGYVYPHAVDKNKTPADFAIDPKTGKGANNNFHWQVAKRDLRQGIEGCTIPCAYIWDKGRWMFDVFDSREYPIYDIEADPVGTKKQIEEQDLYSDDDWAWYIWLTHGEGAPGNFWFYAYLVPEEIAKKGKDGAAHPLTWKKSLREGPSKMFQAKHAWKWASQPAQMVAADRYAESWYLLDHGMLPVSTPTSGGWQGYGGTIGKAIEKATPAAAPKAATTQASALPSGVRFRCSFCGHWYDESGFKAHNASGICAGKDSEGFSDWAVMCHKECGCEVLAGQRLGDKTLDHAGTPKPGFPRPKKEKEVKAEVTETPKAPGTEEDTPTEPEAPAPAEEEVASGA